MPVPLLLNRLTDRHSILAIGRVDRAKQFRETWFLVDWINSGEILAEDLEVARREKTDGNDPLVRHNTSVYNLC